MPISSSAFFNPMAIHHAITFSEVDAKSQDGWTPLHLTAQNGHLDVVEFLVEHRAEVNSKDDDGWTPLHSASQNGRLGVVEFLVEHRAEVNSKDDDGWTPLHSAARNGHLDVVKFLVDLKGAVDYDKLSMDKLSTQRLDISSADTFRRTPIHVALSSSHIETAKVLVEYGADVLVLDGYGKSALDWAFMDQAMFHELGKRSFPYVPTLDTVRVESLRRSIWQLSERLLEAKRRRISPGFHELGHCLMFLQQFDDACLGFE
jgi:hypothetical protein